MYLKLCAKITSSLTEDDLPPLERIYRMWYAKFFLRIWAKWIDRSGLKMHECFITKNAHCCVEINAANLVKLTRKFREQKCETLYVPTIFNSQPCEETFRAFRSMGTMNYTRINFTLLELFHLVGRVELQNDRVFIKLADQNIVFPRKKFHKTQLNQYKLPSHTDITNIINEAKKNAIEDGSKFGIVVEPNVIEQCALKISPTTCEEDVEFEEEGVDDDDNYVPEQNTKPNSLIDITLDNGVTKTIRKSTYLWTLTDPKRQLSNDRLKRVQETKNFDKSANNKARTKPRRLIFRKEISPAPILTLSKNEELQIGDWAIFQTKVNGKPIFAVGNVLSFRYKDGKTAIQRRYTWDFAPVDVPKCAKPRGIEVMASWFEIGSTTTLTPADRLHCLYIDIEKYIITLDCKIK